ncbi:hypothetical protein ACFFQF_26875 [Haladaptatus pallidirubidus]|nr:hypothetical protein [Haladaptatus pallidirubidus]
MAVVENTTDNGMLDTFPTVVDEDEIEPEEFDCDDLGGFPC